jgi:nucleoside-diphosphate-sugar epimerase
MYGPGDDASKFTTHVIRSCLGNAPELRLTPGEQKRDFIYIDDVVAAYLLLLQQHLELPRAFTQLGLGSGQAVRIRDFVEQVHRLSQSRTELKFGALPYRQGEIMESAADIAALQRLGWHARYTLEQGLSQAIQTEAATVSAKVHA